MSLRTLLIRLSIFIFALSVFNAYVALGIITRWPWAQNHIALIACSTVGFLVLELVGFIGDRFAFPILRKKIKTSFNPNFIFSTINWLSYLALGILSCLFIYTALADIGGFVWKLVAYPSQPILFGEYFLSAILGATLTTTIIGIAQALFGPVVREVGISLRKLPLVFDGFKIVQISDLHVGPIIHRDYVEKVVAAVNALKPDMIVLTGDFVDGSVEDLCDQVTPLAQLAAPYGKFFVTGNHEYYSGVEEWCAEFRKLGMRVLLNEHEVIRRKDEAFLLAGVTDYMAPDSSPQKSLEGAPRGLIKILLAHQPATYKEAHAAGFDLQISGHTHGGQYFPFSVVVKAFQRYVRGLNRHENMWIYVSAGTGYWGPPLRTAIPSEITRITLKSAKTSR